MSLVLFKRYTTSQISTLPVVDGQLIWNIETGDTYIDVGTSRIPTGGNYNLPIATNSTLGGIKSGGDIIIDTDTGIVSVNDNSHNHVIDNVSGLQNVLDELQTLLGGKISTTLKGTANGVAELDNTGKVPSSQLPSYVDDVIEGTLSTFPATGESGKIYVDTNTNITYRWSGSTYVEVG